MIFRIDIVRGQQLYFKTLEEVHFGICEIPHINDVVRNMVKTLLEMRKTDRLGDGSEIDSLEGTISGVNLRVTIEK